MSHIFTYTILEVDINQPLILSNQTTLKMTDRIRLGKYLRTALTISDFVILNIAYFCTIWLMGDNTEFASKLVWLIANISFIPSAYFFSDIHKMRIIYADRVVLCAIKSAIVEGGVMATALYVLDVFSIGMYFALTFIGLFCLLLSIWWLISRKVLKKFRRMGLNFKRVIIIGAGKTAELLIHEINGDAGYGYRMMGIFDNDKNALNNVKGNYTNTLDKVSDFVILNKIDVIYYTLEAEDNTIISTMMRIAEEAGASFVYVPKFNHILSGQFNLSSVGNIPVMTQTMSPLHKRGNKILKRILDLSISIPFLIVSPLIFIPIAIAIKRSSPGPVFFKQKRTGIHGTEFVCYKFRTMKVNADSDKLQATENDPRKTKLGDFLRRSSLDELPQFINVLIGNMSIVGPRPHMVSHTEEYSILIDKYMVRHAVKPGISGWAQVNGYRGGTKQLWQMEKRVEYDVWYIRNWNLLLDIKIIFLTIFNGFRGDKNAY